MSSEAYWNRPWLSSHRAAFQQGDCVKVAALDCLGRSLAEVLDLMGWLRENQADLRLTT